MTVVAQETIFNTPDRRDMRTCAEFASNQKQVLGIQAQYLTGPDCALTEGNGRFQCKIEYTVNTLCTNVSASCSMFVRTSPSRPRPKQDSANCRRIYYTSSRAPPIGCMMRRLEDRGCMTTDRLNSTCKCLIARTHPGAFVAADRHCFTICGQHS